MTSKFKEGDLVRHKEDNDDWRRILYEGRTKYFIENPNGRQYGMLKSVIDDQYILDEDDK